MIMSPEISFNIISRLKFDTATITNAQFKMDQAQRDVIVVTTNQS